MGVIVRDMLIITITVGLILIFIQIISRKLISKYGYYWRKLSWILLLYMLLFPVCHLPDMIVSMQSKEENSLVIVEIRGDSDIKSSKNNNLSQSEDSFSAHDFSKINSLKTGIYQFSEKYQKNILWIWIGGMLFSVCFYILIQRKIILDLRLFSTDVEDDNILQIFETAKKNLNIYKPVQIKYCRKIQSPVTTGIFSSVIYIPENMILSNFEWTTVLRHELYHCRAYDLLYKTLIQCIQIILWFHPFVYYIKKCAYEDIEYVCDENVARNMCHFNVKKYCACILKMIPIKQEAVLTFRNSKEKLKKRIDNCLEAKKRKRCSFFVISINVLIILICFGIGIGMDYLWAEDSSEFLEGKKVELVIPSAAEIMKNGYPINEKGETYGPASYWIWDESAVNPDLQLAEGENGVTGYIRESELDELDGHNNVHTPKDAVEYMKKRNSQGDIIVNMYLQDGETVIGKFVIENTN